MRSYLAAVAFWLTTVSVACVGGRSQRSRAPRPEPEAESPATVARAGLGEPGEVVHEMSDALWIVFGDSNGRHWFGSESQGLYRFDGKTLVRYTTADGLCNDHIRHIQEDAEGNVFISTNGGISKFDGQRFATLIPIESTPSASDWKSQPGDLWFTSSGMRHKGGPCRYDGTTLYELELPRIAIEDVFNAMAPGVGYSPYDVYTIHRDRRGALWFGTAVLGVCRYDGSSFRWVTEDEVTDLHIGPSFGVRGIVEDRDGRFWLSNLLHRYDAYPDGAAANETSSSWYTRECGLVDAAAKDDLGNAYFMSGLTDRHGVSWIATYGGGVWRIDGKELTHFPVTQEGQTITLFSIHEDREGVLWLGTQAAGAWRFNGQTFERFRP